MVSVLLSLSILSIITLGVDAAPFQTVYSGLNFPVAFTFAHDGRMFFNEKNTGNVRVIASNGTILIQPFANVGPLPPSTAGSEEGLLGLALDPNFDTNHYLYVYWTYWDGTQKHVRITRFTDAGDLGTSETTIFDFVDPNPGPTNHNGGYIKFGLDGMLYATVGDFCSWDCSGIPMAQNKTNYAGKILRMNPDGSVPPNNPFSGSLIYAYGFRNGIGLDFNSTGGLIATMAGPDCCDRIFFVNSGANLGWPNCGTSSHVTCSPPYTPSLYQWGSTVTPTGIAYSSSDRVLYFGEFNTGNFMQLALTTGGTFSQLNTVASGFSGGVISVEKGPDGRIWFSTSSDIVAYTETKTTTTLTATQTSTLFGTVTSSFTSYTSTTTSTSTVPTVLTLVLIPVTSTVQGTQYQTSFVTVTSYASTSTSTSTIPTVTTVTVGPPTSTIQNTQIVTTNGATTATSVTTTTTTSYTGTQFSTTSTTIVVTTVTTTSSSFGEALIFLSIVGLLVGFGVEAGRGRMVPEVLLRVGRRCLKS